MNILAFDTCFGAASAAAGRGFGGATPEVFSAHRPRTAGADELVPLISEVMAAAALSFDDVDRIAVTIGPGTFSGLRVGVAVARALALATAKPIVGTTSLHVVAHAARATGEEAVAGRHLGVATDARLGQVHFQIFDAVAEPVCEARLLGAAEAARIAAGEGIVLVGSGAPLVVAAAVAEGDAPIALGPVDIEPDARHLALLAPRLSPLTRIIPLYLRAPDAIPQVAAAVPRAPQ
jgi:tRNA threonylcarbamoyladenosine biosynthesis protein TsaB